MKIKDLYVLDLSSVLAGPIVGSFFSELGASVVKVENAKNKGDVTRNWKLPSEDVNAPISAYYAAANFNKTVIHLDFNQINDRKILINEIKKADIVLVNFKHGDAKKFRLTYLDCLHINPKIIYGEISGYGPLNPKTAYDIVLQAETGYLSMNGYKEKPAKLPVAFIDLFAAHQLKSGILTALLEKRQPSKVSVSLFDSAISSLANQATNQLMNNHTPKPIGTLHPNIAPYGEILQFKDNKNVVLAIGSDKQFDNLISILKIKPENRFSTNLLRVKHRNALYVILQDAIKQSNADDFIKACNKLLVPVGKIKNLKQVFETKEAQKLILTENQEGYLTKKVRTTIFTISS